VSLTTYRRKRNFGRTAEPAPEEKQRGARPGLPHFVIQKHDATRLHYDLRLEMGGAFKSWAVPKGLPYAKGERHLAVRVEDHPLSYGGFEGTIPKGEYGGGTVMLWDRGRYAPLTRTPAKDLKAGKLHFALEGEKLKGEWYLVRLRDDKQWLVIKAGEDMKPLPARKDDTSVLSGKSMRQLAANGEEPEAKPRAGKAVKKNGRAPGFVEPMKARLVAEPPKGTWDYEIKFDGWRALILKGGREVHLRSRNDNDLAAKFPSLVSAAAALPAASAVIDGEIAALDDKGRTSFQLLQGYDMGQERPPVFYYAFDILQLDGRDLTDLPLTERRAILAKLLTGVHGDIKLSETLGQDAPRLLKKARAVGLEGLIGKDPRSLYEIGRRSGAWIKLKINREQEFVIGGYTDPTGSRHGLGSIIVGVHERGKLMATGKVGTGFTAATLRELMAKFKPLAATKCPFANLPASSPGKWGQGITAAEMKRCHWLKPRLVCQVKFTEWTNDGRLRHPVFLGLRTDKAASEVVRENPA
jgi:bifunctional non-homologous end joining protein LigD